MIDFITKTLSTTILDPRQGFSPKTIETEVRYDPLTGESGRLAHFGMIKPQKEDFSSWDTPENRSRCPFCSPNIDTVTPRFPPELLPGGHLHRGKTRVIPNIAPYDQYSALTIISPEHIVPLEKLTIPVLKEAFTAGLEFFHLVAEKDQEFPYHTIAWNYMPPSGGGLVHPHQQVIISDSPGNLYRKTMEKSRDYYRRYGKNYWKELCSTEKNREERFIGELDGSCWLTSFVPLGVLGEFWGIFPEVHTIFDFDETTLEELANGLERLFQYFISAGIYSFNMGLFFAPAGEAEEYLSLHARIIPRTFLNLLQKPSDINALQLVLQEPFTVISPEAQCAELKAFW